MLVESSNSGTKLVHRYGATKSSPQDLIALAMEIEKVKYQQLIIIISNYLLRI